MNISRFFSFSVAIGGMLLISAFAQAAASVKVSWGVPVTRENGQSLAVSELVGYELYYTTDDPGVSGAINVSGGTTATYTVPNLAAGNYHFAISAIDVNGLKSKLSAVVDVSLVASTAAPSTPSFASVSATSGGLANFYNNLNVSWLQPKTRSDGVALPLSELSGYTVTLRNFYTGSAVSASVGGGVTSYAIPSVLSGFYIVNLVAVDNSGKQSANANYFIYII